jgi:hypothetical protein
MKIKLFFFLLSFPFLLSNIHAQDNSEIELILNNHNWILVDKYHVNENKDLLGSYKMVFTNTKNFRRPGYIIHIKNNGELTAGNYPLCGTGPQLWSSLSGFWEFINQNTIVFNYTDNEMHYMNMEPPSENNKLAFKPRREIYEVSLINDQYIGLNPIK